MSDENTKNRSMRRIIAVIASSSLGCLPLFFVLFVAVFFTLGIFSGDSGTGSGSSYSSSSECGFTISSTSLSKSEFKSLIQAYADKHSQWQVFADYADDYYDRAKAKGVNPELVVLIAYKEGNGYTTSGTNNYWGLACPNGASSCGGYSSFMEAVEVLLDNAAQYSSLMAWFDVGHYSWIGDYWYNPGSSGLGGCYYAEYIYPDGLPSRVANACNSSIQCSQSNTSSCTATTDEDQTAYANYLVYTVMGNARKTIFGLDVDEGASCTSSTSNVSSSSLIESYVTWMIEIANDDNVGYSQLTRRLNPNVDCSSFVYYALLKGAGFSESELGGSYPFTTYNMDSILKSIGFKVYTYTSHDDLQRGDILWKSSHTEVYIGNDQTVGAHSDKDGKNGDSSGKEVSVSTSTTSWTYYYRYEGTN